MAPFLAPHWLSVGMPAAKRGGASTCGDGSTRGTEGLKGTRSRSGICAPGSRGTRNQRARGGEKPGDNAFALGGLTFSKSLYDMVRNPVRVRDAFCALRTRTAILTLSSTSSESILFYSILTIVVLDRPNSKRRTTRRRPARRRVTARIRPPRTTHADSGRGRLPFLWLFV